MKTVLELGLAAKEAAKYVKTASTKEKNLESALKVVKESLGAEGLGFGVKAEASLDLLEAALGFFSCDLSTGGIRTSWALPRKCRILGPCEPSYVSTCVGSSQEPDVLTFFN